MASKKKQLDLNRIIKKRKPHSQETKNKISEKRRARTTQPRHAGQSMKRTSFYDELLHDYGKVNNKKISARKKEAMEIAIKWIENNKRELGHIPKEELTDRKQLLEQYEKNGVITEYLAMYHSEYEKQVGMMLYSDERTPVNDVVSDDPYDMIDDIVGDYFGENMSEEEAEIGHMMDSLLDASYELDMDIEL